MKRLPALSRMYFLFQYDLHYLSRWPQEDAWNQATFPGDDHKKFEKILYFRSPGNQQWSFLRYINFSKVQIFL